MARTSERQKWLRQTQRKRPVRELPALGTPRIVDIIEPPADFDDDLRRLWQVHMMLAVRAGRMSTADLLGFVEMIHCARAAEMTRKAALEQGPCDIGQKGDTKLGAAWRAWLQTQAQYQSWLMQFGLLPRSRVRLPQLPAPDGGLQLIDGGQDE